MQIRSCAVLQTLLFTVAAALHASGLGIILLCQAIASPQSYASTTRCMVCH